MFRLCGYMLRAFTSVVTDLGGGGGRTLDKLETNTERVRILAFLKNQTPF